MTFDSYITANVGGIITLLLVRAVLALIILAAYQLLVDIRLWLEKLFAKQPRHFPDSSHRQINIPHPQTYQDKLTSPKWKIRREMILNRDNHQCGWCGSTHNLQVHHKYYNRFPNGEKCEPWDYPDDAFMTLCSSCHEKWHKKYKAKLYYRRYNTHYFL